MARCLTRVLPCSHYYSSRPDFERGREPPHAAGGLAGSREESSRLRIKGFSQRIKSEGDGPFFIHSVPSVALTKPSAMPAAKKPTATKKPAASKASDQLALLAKVPSQARASPLRSTPPARTRQRTTQRAHLRLSSSSQRAAMSVGCRHRSSHRWSSHRGTPLPPCAGR